MVADAKALEKKEKPVLTDPKTVRDFRGSWSGYERDFLFYNPDGPHPRFYNAGYVSGLDFDDDGRCAVPVDVDGDGDLDLVCLSLQGLRLMENTLPAKHFLRVRLRATKTHPSALNAVVRVTAGGVTQQDYVRLTDGFMSQVPAELHFGLGGARAVERMEVVWPSGDSKTYEGIAADQLVEIEEGGQPRGTPLPRWPENTRPRLKPAFNYEIIAPRLEGGDGPVAEKGRPVVVNFWAPTCAPCKEELPALARLAARVGDEARFVGVTTEKEGAEAFGLAYPQFVANDALVRSFFGAEGRVVLPSTFVFDRGGKLRRVFQRPVGEAELEGLLASFREGAPASADYERRGSHLVEQGRYEEGLDFLQKALPEQPKNAIIRYHMGIACFHLGRDTDALMHFRSAVELEPDYARARFNYGETLRKVGRFAESVEQFEAVIRLRGEDANTLFSLGDAAASAGQYPRALDAFERSLKREPANVPLLCAKAQVHMILKQPEEARKALNRALELKPGDARARKMLDSLPR
ncbi:MAG: tetratricopeptide repeat protein [Planctomycetes bacterium]|nr:tetratricopeptide repeat protein [Planctomycetota bacterium]